MLITRKLALNSGEGSNLTGAAKSKLDNHAKRLRCKFLQHVIFVEREAISGSTATDTSNFLINFHLSDTGVQLIYIGSLGAHVPPGARQDYRRHTHHGVSRLTSIAKRPNGTHSMRRGSGLTSGGRWCQRCHPFCLCVEFYT